MARCTLYMRLNSAGVGVGLSSLFFPAETVPGENAFHLGIFKSQLRGRSYSVFLGESLLFCKKETRGARRAALAALVQELGKVSRCLGSLVINTLQSKLLTLSDPAAACRRDCYLCSSGGEKTRGRKPSRAQRSAEARTCRAVCFFL